MILHKACCDFDAHDRLLAHQRAMPSAQATYLGSALFANELNPGEIPLPSVIPDAWARRVCTSLGEYHRAEYTYARDALFWSHPAED